MSTSVPKSEWAIEKVRVYVPQSKEKSTLLAIAGYMNYQSGLCNPSVDAIAHDSGHSVRTVQRHIMKLEADGLLVVDRPSQFEHRRSRYRIPCCSFTTEELELITGIDATQLSLGILDPEIPGKVLLTAYDRIWLANSKSVTDCHPMGDSLTPNGCQTDTLTWFKHGNNKEPAQAFELKTKKERLQLRSQKAFEWMKIYSDMPSTEPYDLETLKQVAPRLYEEMIAEREARSVPEEPRRTRNIDTSFAKKVADLAPAVAQELLKEAGGSPSIPPEEIEAPGSNAGPVLIEQHAS